MISLEKNYVDRRFLEGREIRDSFKNPVNIMDYLKTKNKRRMYPGKKFWHNINGGL